MNTRGCLCVVQMPIMIMMILIMMILMINMIIMILMMIMMITTQNTRGSVCVCGPDEGSVSFIQHLLLSPKTHKCHHCAVNIRTLHTGIFDTRVAITQSKHDTWTECLTSVQMAASTISQSIVKLAQ